MLRAMRRRITHVFFDATDTLMRVRGSVGATYGALARQHGVEVPAIVLQDAFAEAVRSIPQPVQPGLTESERTARERQWWSDVVARTFGGSQHFEDFGRFFDELFELFRDADAWELMPHARESIQRLQERGVTLGIISDMDSRLFGILRGFDLQAALPHVFLSFTTGYCKPDRRLFETACRETGADVASTLHVGDSWKKDVQGARDAGLVGVWYRPSGATDEAWPWVADLQQLPDLVDREER